jgi:hypothetical protein
MREGFHHAAEALVAALAVCADAVLTVNAGLGQENPIGKCISVRHGSVFLVEAASQLKLTDEVIDLLLVEGGASRSTG